MQVSHASGGAGVSSGQSGKPLAEDVTGTPSVETEEPSEGEIEGELATADGQVREDTAVPAVDMIGRLTADRAQSVRIAGCECDCDQVWGENQIGRRQMIPEELGKKFRR